MGSTYAVDGNSAKDGTGDGAAILRVILTAHDRVVVLPEERAEDAQDDNGEDGDDDALERVPSQLLGWNVRSYGGVLGKR